MGREQAVDLIVMPTREVTTDGSMLYAAAQPEQVLRRVRCPLLSIPP
jgi:hypothetical protein